MGGLIADGQVIPVDGLDVVNFQDDPSVALSPEDGRRRPTGWVRCGILHTTLGIPGRPADDREQYVIPGAGSPGKARAVAEGYIANPEPNAADCIVGRARGECVQLADLVTMLTYHATSVNPYSVGLEMVQEPDGGVYEAVYDNAVLWCEAVARVLGIQRQIHRPYRPYRPVPRLAAGGRDCVGFFGHRDQTDRRYLGDPGDEIFERLVGAGWEVFDFAADEDKAVWAARQRKLGLDDDGIPGPQTVARLEAEGYAHGLWTLQDAAPVPSFEGALKRALCRALGCA